MRYLKIVSKFTVFILAAFGLFSLFVVMDLSPSCKVSKDRKIFVDLKELEASLLLFYMDNGVFPTTEQGLKILGGKPDRKSSSSNHPNDRYMKVLPVDPWGNEYKYVYIDAEDRGLIYSVGYQVFRWVESPNDKLLADAESAQQN